VPVCAIYLYGNKTMFNLGFFQGDKIQKPEQLKGARIGILSLASGSVNVLKFILKEVGLSERDVTLIPIGSGQSALAAMKNHEIDALMYHDTGFVNFEANGIKFNMYKSPKLDAGYAGVGVWALEDRYKKDRDLFVRFLRGYTKSLAYAVKDPAGATAAFGKLHPEVAKNPKLEEAMWRERMKLMPTVGPGGVKGWGYIRNEKVAWDNLFEVQLLAGLIKSKPPIDKLFTPELLDDVNKVDLSKLP
jgi:ABC-type nitrate/sulfonate/bicarbonate transport system substrate-binding protein